MPITTSSLNFLLTYCCTVLGSAELECTHDGTNILKQTDSSSRSIIVLTDMPNKIKCSSSLINV